MENWGTRELLPNTWPWLGLKWSSPLSNLYQYCHTGLWLHVARSLDLSREARYICEHIYIFILFIFLCIINIGDRFIKYFKHFVECSKTFHPLQLFAQVSSSQWGFPWPPYFKWHPLSCPGTSLFLFSALSFSIALFATQYWGQELFLDCCCPGCSASWTVRTHRRYSRMNVNKWQSEGTQSQD